jgi:hypothetical protein
MENENAGKRLVDKNGKPLPSSVQAVAVDINHIINSMWDAKDVAIEYAMANGREGAWQEMLRTLSDETVLTLSQAEVGNVSDDRNRLCIVLAFHAWSLVHQRNYEIPDAASDEEINTVKQGVPYVCFCCGFETLRRNGYLSEFIPYFDVVNWHGNADTIEIDEEVRAVLLKQYNEQIKIVSPN